MSNLFQKKEVHLFYNLGTDKRPEKFRPFVMFARHGRALTGASPEHAQIVGSV